MNKIGHNQFQFEFAEWLTDRDEGYEAVVRRVNRERKWGGGGSKDDRLQLWKKLETRDELTAKKKEHLVWRCCKLFAKVPNDIWTKWIEAGERNKDTFCVNTMRKLAIRYWRTENRKARNLRALKKEGVAIYHGDIRTIRSLQLGKAAAIITDPPYPERFLDLWEHLAIFSDAVLQDSGWLVVMSGQLHLPKVMEKLNHSGMRYCWTISLRTLGAGNNVFMAPKIPVNTFWKPILIYCKGEKPQGWPDELSDILDSPRPMKDNHDWGQNVDVFTTLVEKFAPPGQLVVDPFLGGGTTGQATVRTKARRQFEGFDADLDVIGTAEKAVTDEIARRGELFDTPARGKKEE